MDPCPEPSPEAVERFADVCEDPLSEDVAFCFYLVDVFRACGF